MLLETVIARYGSPSLTTGNYERESVDRMLKFNSTGGPYNAPKGMEGVVYTVNSDRTYDRDSPDHLHNRIVAIDGNEYLVKGVESPAIATIRKNCEIGLLVIPSNKSDADNG